MSPVEASGVLEPQLTPYDKRVLKAIPDGTADKAPEPIDLWALGRALDDRDLDGLARVLSGMEHFGLVRKVWRGRKDPDAWTLTAKGLEAIA